MNIESGIQLGELWAIARRRGKVVAAVAGFIFLAVYWLSMAMTNQYESYATILVEPQSVSPELVQAGVRESDLTERLHLMTAQILSRPRLSRMIDQFELYQEEAEDMTREEVIDLMRDAVRVEPVVPELERRAAFLRREAPINQFRIYFWDPNPKKARDVAQRMANDFIEEHINERVKISQKSLEFIEGELERIGQRMMEIEAEVAKLKAENPGRLPEDVRANQGRLDRLTDAIARAQRDYDEARSDEAFWRSQFIAVGAMGATSDDTSPLRRIQLLELQIAELQARGFTEKHPDYIKARIELEGLRSAVAARELKEEEVEAPPSFAQQTAEAERRRAELRMEAAQEEIDRLQVAAEQYQTLLAEAPRVAEKLDGLGREYQSQLDSYQTYIVRRQQAGVQADMERRQLGEQFRVLEAAFIAPEPTSPNRLLIIALGTVFALVVAAGAGGMLEITDPSVHNARQLQATMSLPVLAAIPRIWLESDRVARRRRALRQAFASVGVALFMLAGGAVTYGWVNGMPGFAKDLLGMEEEASQPQSAAPAGAEG